jgi:hypothetical protein
MSGFQHLRDCQHLIHGKANKILSELLKSNFESCLVIFTFTHGIADNTITITNEE